MKNHSDAALSPVLLGRLARLVAAQMGLEFAPQRRTDLERGVRQAAPDLDCEDAATCLRRLCDGPLSPREIEVLADHLTVGETYFLRDKNAVSALEKRILPQLIAARRKGAGGKTRSLRLWSAGCCTGEEAYSLAILLHRLLPDLAAWRVSILATDLNPRFLERARAGIFGDWSFRDTPSWLKDRYFSPTPDGRRQIASHIRRMVVFAPLNLVSDAYPLFSNKTNDLDLIVCRNVLMYLAPEHALRVVEKFARCLGQGGWLSVHPSETSYVLEPSLLPVNFPGATFYRKSAPDVGSGEKALERREKSVDGKDSIALPLVSSSPHSLVPIPHAPPPLERARELADAGDLDAALSCCEEAISADKMNAEGYYLRATILQEQNAWAEAVSALRQAVYLRPDFVLAHYALGNCARAQGKIVEARRHFENALETLGRHAPADILPHSEGLTAGRLSAIVTGVLATLNTSTTP